MVAALVLGAGILVAALGYQRTGGPGSAVSGYFAALARADAPAALAYGDVPDGPHVLLTRRVLAAQQRIAPIGNVRLGTTVQSGSQASVQVGYDLAFPGETQRVHDVVRLHERGNRWRLDAVAVSTRFTVQAALHRATVAGAGVPAGTVLAFPGAVPVSFDTPYLKLSASEDFLTLDGTSPTTQVFVRVSDAGRSAVRQATSRSLDACYGAHADPAALCPLPGELYVPGRLHGQVVGALDDVSVDVARDVEGTLEITGQAQVRGSWEQLTFDGRLTSGSGTVKVPVDGRAFPVAPLAISWNRGT